MNNGMLVAPGREPTDLEVAWLAGLYEGEGTCRAHKHVRGAVLNIRMTDEDILRRCHEIFGGGFLGPYWDTYGMERGYKGKYRWEIHSWRDIKRVVSLIYPYLGARRKGQIDAMMAQAPEFERGTAPCERPIVASYAGERWHRRNGVPMCDRCKETYVLAIRAKTLKKNPLAIERPEHRGKHLIELQ